MKNLFQALIKAQGAMRSVDKDGRNSFHKYDYTTAETILLEAKAVLREHGLGVAPVAHRVERPVKDADHEYPATLRRTYLVMHESGESMEMTQEWPIVPERGRPDDKATAAADTTSLAYFLRDLLQIPRCDEEVDRRDDTHRQTRKPNAGQSTPASKAAAFTDATKRILTAMAGATSQEDIYKIEAAIEAKGIELPGDHRDIVRAYGLRRSNEIDELPSFKDLTPKDKELAMRAGGMLAMFGVSGVQHINEKPDAKE